MLNRLISIIGSLAICAVVSISNAQGPTFNQIPFDNDAYAIYYAVEGNKITFRATVQTTGFVGFGVTNNTGMIESDIFIGGVNSNGESYFGDYDSSGTQTPTLDTVQNWELIEASEEDGVTSITFSRLLNTGDWAQDVIIENKEMGLIWAFSSKDEVVDGSYHGGNRDQVFFNLLSSSTTDPPSSEPTTVVSVTSDSSSSEPIESSTSTSTDPSTTDPDPIQFIEIPFESDVYSIKYTIQEDKITFRATVQTTGFVGFGVTNNTGMIESDIFIGGVNSNGESYFGDYDSSGTQTPTLDTVQNWELIEASEEDGVTSVTFSRLLNTGDWAQDVIIENKEMGLIWAFSSKDEVVDGSYHGGNRDQVFFNLLSSSTTDPPSSEPTTAVSVTSDSSSSEPIESSTSASTDPSTTDPDPIQFIEIPFESDVYSIKYAIQGDKITFRATVQTTGFVGFGVTNNTGMIESDIFIGGVNSNGESYFGDYDSSGTQTPTLDVAQNWDLIEATEEEGVTSITFSRLLNTGDWAQDVIIENKEMGLIWAFSSKDEVDDGSYHGGNRDQVFFNLLSQSTGGTSETNESPTSTTVKSSTPDSAAGSFKPLSFSVFTFITLIVIALSH